MPYHAEGAFRTATEVTERSTQHTASARRARAPSRHPGSTTSSRQSFRRDPGLSEAGVDSGKEPGSVTFFGVGLVKGHGLV